MAFHDNRWTVDLRLLFSCVPVFVGRDRITRKPYMALLEIRNLTVTIDTDGRSMPVVENLSLSIQAGEILALVGESGSGKTVSALSIARLLPSPPVRYPSGQIMLDGRDVLLLRDGALRQVRGKLVSYVFQEPAASLNPVLRVGAQIRESLRLHRPDAATRTEVVRLLNMVGIPEPEQRRHDYAHQLSGGMQQRVMMAMAIASHPKLLVADEPTTALDVTVQAQILDLLRQLCESIGTSILLITHNLGIVGEVADRIAVIYAGQVVETGPARNVLRRPYHPYTRALLNAVPKPGADLDRLTAIPGTVPHPNHVPSGCRFHPRCQFAQHDCTQGRVPLLEAGPDRQVRCPYFQRLP